MNYEFLIFVLLAFTGMFLIIPETWKSILSDFKLLSLPNAWTTIKKERYDKHFYWSFLISFSLQTLMILLHIMQFHTHEWYESLFLMSFGLCLINSCREGYIQFKGGRDDEGNWNIQFSWGDIRFGTYGGFFGSLASSLVLSLLV
jgi:hypothetical protein